MDYCNPVSTAAFFRQVMAFTTKLAPVETLLDSISKCLLRLGLSTGIESGLDEKYIGMNMIKIKILQKTPLPILWPMLLQRAPWMHSPRHFKSILLSANHVQLHFFSFLARLIKYICPERTDKKITSVVEQASSSMDQTCNDHETLSRKEFS